MQTPEEPDWTALYPVGGSPGPAVAFLLAAVGDLMIDSETRLEDYELPPIGERYAANSPAFVGRLHRRLISMVADFKTGEPWAPSCTADEVLIKILVEDAITAAEEDDHWGWTARLEALPQVESLSSDLEAWREKVTEDFDVDLLWAPNFDGIENLEEFRGVNLHPRNWFVPFVDT